MATIADNLASLAATKAKLKDNLLLNGIDASAENNFDDLVDMAFDEEIAWLPDPDWLAVQDLRTWTPEGAIGLIISDYGYGKTSFIIDTEGAAQYTVVVNDGTTDISTTNYASGAQADISVTAGDGTTYYAVKITSAAAIQGFRVARTAGLAASWQNVTLLWFYGHLSSLTNCSNMFYKSPDARCALLQAVHIDSTSSVTNMSYMFYLCSSLRSVPAVMDTSKVTNMASMFYLSPPLRSLPAVFNVASATDGTSFGASLRSLSRDLLDLSAAVITTKLQITEAQGLRGLLVSSSATWTGTAPQIEITDCGLDRTALVALFNSLGTIAGKTIKITGNPGVADLTAGDLAIATDKGWTVTTT